MAHEHETDQSSFYLDQLCTIGICGALGGVAVMLYNRGLLTNILHEGFHKAVLAAGITLLVIVAIRAVAVWFSIGQSAGNGHTHDHGHDADSHHDHAHHDHACDGHDAHVHGSTTDCEHHHHDHVHTAACDHGHGHGESSSHTHNHTHSHDHGHEHTWAPWRYAILLLPVVLYFLNMPSKGLSAPDDITADGVDGKALADRGFDVNVDFQQLERARLTPESRQYYEGKSVRLDGQFAATNNPKVFALVRFRMSCCAADAIPLKALFMVDSKTDEKLDAQALSQKWVQVTGQVQFQQLNDRDEYAIIVLLRPNKEHPLSELVKPIPQPSNIYLYN